MSERADRIVAALDEQWRPTADVADRAQVGEGVRMSSVYHSLNQAVKYRQAEKRVVEPRPGVRVAEWRRLP